MPQVSTAKELEEFLKAHPNVTEDAVALVMDNLVNAQGELEIDEAATTMVVDELEEDDPVLSEALLNEDTDEFLEIRRSHAAMEPETASGASKNNMLDSDIIVSLENDANLFAFEIDSVETDLTIDLYEQATFETEILPSLEDNGAEAENILVLTDEDVVDLSEIYNEADIDTELAEEENDLSDLETADDDDSEISFEETEESDHEAEAQTDQAENSSSYADTSDYVEATAENDHTISIMDSIEQPTAEVAIASPEDEEMPLHTQAMMMFSHVSLPEKKQRFFNKRQREAEEEAMELTFQQLLMAQQKKRYSFER